MPPILIGLEPALRVRVAAHQHECLRAHRQVRLAHSAADVTSSRARLDRRPFIERTIRQEHRALGRRSQSRDDVEQRALAGAVASHDRHELARRRRRTKPARARAPFRHASRRSARGGRASSDLDSVEPARHGPRHGDDTRTGHHEGFVGDGMKATLTDGLDERLALPQAFGDAAATIGIRGRSPISPTSTMTSGAELMTVSMEMRGYSRLADASTFDPPAMVAMSFRYEPGPTAMMSESVPVRRPTMIRIFRGARPATDALTRSSPASRLRAAARLCPARRLRR